MKTLYTFLLLLALPLVTFGATGPGSSGGSGSATNAVTAVKTNNVNIGTGRTSLDFTNTGNIAFAGFAAGAGARITATVPSGATLDALNLTGNTTASNIIAASITMSNRLFAAPSPGGVVQIDGTWANVHTMTNQALGSFSLVITNMSASQQWMVMVPGTASGSTNIIVTLIPETGKLIRLDGSTLGLTASRTDTNLQYVNFIGGGWPYRSTNTIGVISERGLQ